MPRPTLPRLKLPSLARWRNRDPDAEHDGLLLIAEIAGVAVVTCIVAGFVLMAATSGGDATTTRPAVPTITDAGGPAPAAPDPELALPPDLPEPPAIAPPTTTKTTKVVAPKPKPPKPKPAPKPPPPDNDDDDGDDGPGNGNGNGGDDDGQTAWPWSDCSPEGSRAETPKRHLPLVCRDGHWHFVS
ncbi:MAG: hypothetical protein ACRDSK_26005 [Actinophytocola sp.]|uniref:hypothetical protein n=1 Tax=Actinophytocola sp. TaxID=1872138 RepID=UPI003D6AE7ED